jgi:hypothetical protein
MTGLDANTERAMSKAIVAAALAVAVVGCGDEDEITRIQGEAVEVTFGADARAFARAFGLRRGNEIIEIGLELPMTAIENAAVDGDFEVPVPQAVTTDTGFAHIWLNYAAEGHFPPGVFDVPHFDVHFYLLDKATRAAITCPEAEVPRERIPAGYVIPGFEGEPEGACVPGMGVHAVPVTTGEEPFTATMTLVYHDGYLVAVEPMFTQQLLRARTSFTLDIPAPDEQPPGIDLPTRFIAEHDEDANLYRFRLQGFGE